MKRKKRFFFILRVLMAAILLLSLAGCNRNTTETNTDNAEMKQDITQSVTTQETVENTPDIDEKVSAGTQTGEDWEELENLENVTDTEILDSLTAFLNEFTEYPALEYYGQDERGAGEADMFVAYHLADPENSGLVGPIVYSKEKYDEYYASHFYSTGEKKSNYINPGSNSTEILVGGREDYLKNGDLELDTVQTDGTSYYIKAKAVNQNLSQYEAALENGTEGGITGGMEYGTVTVIIKDVGENGVHAWRLYSWKNKVPDVVWKVQHSE